jgi:hypothetical protein
MSVVNSVNRTDARMVQSREQLRFAFESSATIGVATQSLGKNFEGDVTIEAGVASAVDLAHATRANHGEYFVRPYAGSGYERHSFVVIGTLR